jgi:hypothetical protein
LRNLTNIGNKDVACGIEASDSGKTTLIPFRFKRDYHEHQSDEPDERHTTAQPLQSAPLEPKQKITAVVVAPSP